MNTSFILDFSISKKLSIHHQICNKFDILRNRPVFIHFRCWFLYSCFGALILQIVCVRVKWMLWCIIFELIWFHSLSFCYGFIFDIVAMIQVFFLHFILSWLFIWSLRLLYQRDKNRDGNFDLNFKLKFLRVCCI